MLGKWLACQAMDNRITIFGVHNNFRLNRKKSFRGHMVAGYSCVPDFSPDGRSDSAWVGSEGNHLKFSFFFRLSYNTSVLSSW